MASAAPGTRSLGEEEALPLGRESVCPVAPRKRLCVSVARALGAPSCRDTGRVRVHLPASPGVTWESRGLGHMSFPNQQARGGALLPRSRIRCARGAHKTMASWLMPTRGSWVTHTKLFKSSFSWADFEYLHFPRRLSISLVI